MSASKINNRTSRRPTMLSATAAIPSLYIVVAINLPVWLVASRLLGQEVPASLYDQQRILQLVGLLALVALVVGHGRVRRGVLDAFARIPAGARLGLGVLVVLGIASSVGAAIPSAALREVGLFVLLAVMSLVVAAARRRCGTAFERQALGFLVGAASTYAVMFAVLDLSVDRGSSMFGFDNPRIFGQVALWSFPLLVTAAVQEHGRPAVRLGRWLAVTAWWALLLESGGRSALYGSLLGLAVVSLVVGKDAARWLRASILGLVAGTALWFAWTSVAGHGSGGLLRMVEKGADGSGRLEIWGETLRLAAASPLLGVGPEHYAYHGARLASPHSVPLQIAAEWGIPAALIAGSLICWGVVCWLWEHRRGQESPGATASDDRSVISGLTAAIIAAVFASLLEGIVLTPPSQMLFAVVVGWALGRHPFRKVLPAGERSTAEAAMPLVALMAALAVGTGALPYALQPSAEVRAYLDGDPDTLLAPRFWIVGRLDR